jgi:tRNA (cytidine/uridine-2'-O-)-methyltransferase
MDTYDSPLLHIVLIEPEIPPNTGNVARLCAANSLALHLVGKLGFSIADRDLRRAGLDYWDAVDLRLAADAEALRRSLPGARFFLFSARAERPHTEARYRAGDCLVFGPESRGLPEVLLRAGWGEPLRIPMRSQRVRSLNLSTAVGIAAYEALRQLELVGA